MKYILATALITALMALFPVETVGLIVLLCSTVVWGTFTVWYSLRARWWRNPYGRNTMGTSVGIFALLLAFCAELLYGRFPGDQVLWTLVFLNLGIMAVHRTYHMEKVQRGIAERETRQ